MISPNVVNEAVNGIILVVLFGFTCFSEQSKTSVPIFHRGFFCDDATIRYPYKDSTVPFWWIGMLYPFVLVLLMVPLSFIQLRSASKSSSRTSEDGCVSICRKNELDGAGTISCSQTGEMFYLQATTFLAGMFLNGLLTNIVKHSAGRLRPNFVSVCQPAACNHSIVEVHEFVSEPLCQSSHPEWVLSSRLSFPSGHSSCAFYVFVFTALYLQRSLGSCLARSFLLPMLQCFSIVCACLVAVSRICDNKHHATDVIAGGTLGTLVAILFGYFVAERRGPRAATGANVYYPKSNSTAEDTLVMHTVDET